MPVWAVPVFQAIASFINKFGGAIAGFMAGRSHANQQHAKKDHEATKTELEAEYEAGDILSDDSRLAELRNKWKGSE